MSAIGKAERETHNRVIALFRDELGYRYLGDWSDRPDNSNIQEDLLTAHLTKVGHAPEQISRAIYLLRTEADNSNRSVYDNNNPVNSLLRYEEANQDARAGPVHSSSSVNWISSTENFPYRSCMVSPSRTTGRRDSRNAR